MNIPIEKDNIKPSPKLFEMVMLAALIALFFFLQLPKINNAPWEEYDSWRQTDTYTIAQNYVQFNFNPLRPQFNYDGTGENYVQLELQVMPWISAVVYELLGSQPFWVPRLISLVMFMLSAVFLFKIARMYFSAGASLGAAAVYLFLPISKLYSRAIMPEAAVLLFYIAAIYFFLKWYEKGRLKSLYASGIFTALAIMEKTPAIFIGLMFIVLFFKKEKLASFKKPYFYIFGAISLAVPLAYYLYASSVATFTFVNNIAEKHILTSMFTAFFTRQSFDFFKLEIPRMFGIVAVMAAFFGLLCCFKKKNLPLIMWCVSMVLETVMIVAVIRFGYYLVFLAPLVAVLCAAFFDFVGRKNQAGGVILTFACAGFILIHSINSVSPLISVNETITNQAETIKSVSELDDLIAVGASDPVLLGAANRRGFRANLKYYDYIPEKPSEEIAYFIDKGVSYFVVLNGKIPGDNGEYIDYLDKNFEIEKENPDCAIYNLGAKKR